MALDNEDRAYLEKIIDGIINEVPAIMKMVRTEEYKKFVQYKDEGDVVLALATGIIHGRFAEYFVTRQQRAPNPDEVSESNQVIYRRVREITEAIFKCG